MPTPAELLEQNVVLTPSQVAVVLNLRNTRGYSKGDLNVRAARDLIRSGALQLVDPSLAPHRWTVACAEVRRYMTEGPRPTVGQRGAA